MVRPSPHQGERTTGPAARSVPRLAALGALVAACVVVVVVLLTSGSDYEVHARFRNASQIVKGDQVQVAGLPMGSVEQIRLADDGSADLLLKIDPGYAPLHVGTRATVRQKSLSGEANRYVELQPGSQTAPKIASGGTIPLEDTFSAVDIDQLFNIFDRRTRRDASHVIKGFAEATAGREREANQALLYLDPALVTSARLFAELDRDTPALRRFVDETGAFVTTVASKREDLTRLVRNLAATSTAIAGRRGDLAEAIGRLPSFLRKADSTFVDLRSTLDDLRPLVDASKPVVRKLRPLLADLRPFARDAAPTLRDLARTIRRPGPGNDLVELLRDQPPLARAALDDRQVNGATRRGAFPEAADALRSAAPELGFARPYAVDLTSWFDDFSHSGIYDALGGFSRAGLALSAFTFTPILGGLVPVPPALREQVLAAGADLYRNNRCPGSIEREPPDHSTTWRPTPDYDCDPSERPIGP